MSAIELDVTRSDEVLASCPADRSQHPSASRGANVGQIPGVVTGTLIGFKDEGQTPLVLYPGQPGTAAVGAVSVVDLRGGHIGRQVALAFETGDPRRPMIVGLLRNPQAWSLPEQTGSVEVDADGERLIVSAKEQLVLRCGKASITLTKSGKILIQGAYVSSRSSGVIRIKGGAVQIN
jgi:hypothetical protein